LRPAAADNENWFDVRVPGASISPFLTGLLIAGLVVCGGIAFCRLTQRRFSAESRRAFEATKVAGTLPPELLRLDLENMPLDDVGLRVSRSTQLMVAIAHWLTDFAVVLVPIVIAICVLSAVWLGRLN
jgi:hypothetical protein